MELPKTLVRNRPITVDDRRHRPVRNRRLLGKLVDPTFSTRIARTMVSVIRTRSSDDNP
jgi:hypothetical protein